VLSYKLSCLSQVVCLFCAYLGLASVKHAKSKLSLSKFFSDFPDEYYKELCSAGSSIAIPEIPDAL